MAKEDTVRQMFQKADAAGRGATASSFKKSKIKQIDASTAGGRKRQEVVRKSKAANPNAKGMAKAVLDEVHRSILKGPGKKK